MIQRNTLVSVVKYSLITLVCAVILAGCASSHRYLGVFNQEQQYINGGYGIVLPLKKFEARWIPLTGDTDNRQYESLRPTRKDTPIDINGDGINDPSEKQIIDSPTLRLVSVEDPQTTIEIFVEILDRQKGTLKEILNSRQKSLPEGSEVSNNYVELKIAGRYPCIVTEFTNSELHTTNLAGFIDHKPFLAENNTSRRQLVLVVLRTPKITASRRDDYLSILKNLLLAKESIANLQQP